MTTMSASSLAMPTAALATAIAAPGDDFGGELAANRTPGMLVSCRTASKSFVVMSRPRSPRFGTAGRWK